MSDALANQIAKLFIARPDVKAVQVSQGYMPHADRRADEGSGYFPWTRQALNEHINGTRSYGHYMLSKDSQVKLFAFDIDLQKEGWVPLDFDAAAGDHDFVHVPDLRAAWQNRAHPGRPFIKYQLKSVAHMLAKTVTELLELPCAVAYSGNKGLHVYAFTGLIDAADARVGAQIVMDELVRFKPTKGDNFFVDERQQTGGLSESLDRSLPQAGQSRRKDPR
jgi:hypothetical protein